jgi:DNA mismatch endonuclease (patch repair protein)
LYERLKSVHKICACGCGQEVKISSKCLIADFIHGHNKGHNMNHSDATKEKISKKSKEMFAIPEFKEKFKIIMKESHSTLEARENNKKAQNRPEVKTKIIDGLKKFYTDTEHKKQLKQRCKEVQNRPEVRAKTKATLERPEIKEKMRLMRLEIASRPGNSEKHRLAYEKLRLQITANVKKAMSKPEVKQKIADTMSRMIAEGKIKPGRMFNTKPELLMQEALIKKGYELGKSLISQFHCKKIGMIDLFIPEKNALIEIDGDYWHCNPNKYANDFFHKSKKMTAQQIWDNDKKKNETSSELGYKMIRVWESDIYKDINLCVNNIEKQLI